MKNGNRDKRSEVFGQEKGRASPTEDTKKWRRRRKIRTKVNTLKRNSGLRLVGLAVNHFRAGFFCESNQHLLAWKLKRSTWRSSTPSKSLVLRAKNGSVARKFKSVNVAIIDDQPLQSRWF